MGERRLVNVKRGGLLSALSFTESGVCYFDRAWLRKAADIVGGEVI